MFDNASILGWIALAIIVSLSPGPDVLLVAGHAARRGLTAGLTTVAGITVGGIWYMALCGLGFLSLLALSPILFTIVKVAGALYLAWIGLKLIAGAVRPCPEAEGNAPVLGAPFRQGLLATILNPKVALFYLAVLPQFVGIDEDAPLKGVLLIGIHYAINAPWLAVVALAAARAGKAIRHGTVARWIEGALGAAFLGLAGRLALARH